MLMNEKVSRRAAMQEISAMAAFCMGSGTATHILESRGERAAANPDAYDLRNEPEILAQHRKLPLILDRSNYVENVFIAVGFASGCWSNPEGVFDTDNAIRVANELCAMIRLHKEGKIK